MTGFVYNENALTGECIILPFPYKLVQHSSLDLCYVSQTVNVLRKIPNVSVITSILPPNCQDSYNPGASDNFFSIFLEVYPRGALFRFTFRMLIYI